MNWYLAVLQNYVGFSGRAHRQEYWMFILIYLVIYAVLAVVENLIGLTGILTGLYWLALFLPGLAVGVRRLHDTDRTGWWLLVALIPIIGVIVLIIFLCLPGSQGPNQYGPDPHAA